MIRLENVHKVYRGLLRLPREEVRALDGVSLRVAPGSAVGVIGPNGAGKSTFIRLLLGYLRPTEGKVSIGGLAPRAYAERHGIGYVPERVAIPPRWTTAGALRAYAALGEVDDHEERIAAMLRCFGLEEVADRRVGALSKGSLQRLALAQAILAPRKLLVLDEPADGLDPGWVERIRSILLQWREEDPERVLVFASHDLAEVELIADRALVLHQGRIQEEIAVRRETGAGGYRLRLHRPGDAALARRIFPDAKSPPGDPLLLVLAATDAGELNGRIARFLEQGGLLESLAPEGLEQRYRRSFSTEEER